MAIRPFLCLVAQPCLGSFLAHTFLYAFISSSPESLLFLAYCFLGLSCTELMCSVPSCAQVDLYENGTIAIVEAVSPELGNRVQRVRVQLPGTSQELLQRFREKSVDFAAHSNTEDGGAVFLNLLGASPACACLPARVHICRHASFWKLLELERALFAKVGVGQCISALNCWTVCGWAKLACCCRQHALDGH